MNREKSKYLLQAAAVCGLFFLFVYDTQTVALQMNEGLRTILAVTPSVFPMLVLSGLSMRSGLLPRAANRFGGSFERIFRMPRAAFPAVLLGLVSGFPVGAKCSAELYERGALTKEEAQRLASFTNFCSPLFLVGGVGRAALGDVRAGCLLYAFQTFFALVFGAVYKRPKKHVIHIAQPFFGAPESFFHALTGAVSSSALQMLGIGGSILFFRMLSGVLRQMLPARLITGGAVCLFFGFFELSSGVSSLPQNANAPVYAALVAGFSGVSVLMQCASFLGEKGLSARGMIFSHILCAAFLSAAASVFLPLL